MGKILGGGSYSQVFTAMETDSGRIIAVKKIEMASFIPSEAFANLEVSSYPLYQLNSKSRLNYRF